LCCPGITERGGHIVYKANVKEIITEPLTGEQATSSSSSDGADVQATGEESVAADCVMQKGSAVSQGCNFHLHCAWCSCGHEVAAVRHGRCLSEAK
jgi:hypothetical protein